MQDQFEVLFCDLCNTSVPLQDLESGAAVKHQGKTIGACCLKDLRQSAPLADAAPKAAHPAENSLVPLGFVLLAAIAAATIFLDHQLSQRSSALAAAHQESLVAIHKNAAALQDLAVGLEGSARRDDVGGLTERMLAAASANQEALGGVDQKFEHLRTAIESLQARVQELREQRIDYRPALERIESTAQQVKSALADLQAAPRTAPSEASMPQPAHPGDQPPAIPGLPADLAHHVAKLSDTDPAARFEAVDELLRSKNPAVREHILPMAKDADTFVRRLVVEGLREFHHASCVEALLVALSDPEEIVRDTAWRSLKELTGQKLPFEAGAAKEPRARAIQRWQEWWEKNKAAFG